ncbi:MAG TPA: hypothetical protein VEH04_16925 [Verrucomicrobiae bacterium]|nr:hypothetical protein [Verrucomicrobiae bacterium]
MALPQVNKNALDVAQIFQTYVAFNGDAGKTALTLDIDVETVRDLASAEHWTDKVREWNKLREGDPRNTQIQINRAVNYVQAHRARALLDKVIQHLSQGDAEDLVDRLTVNTKFGPEFKTRALTDLVKAMEACQLMTQRALGDTAEERPTSQEDGKGSNVALLVMNAMNAAESSGLDSVALVRQQLAQESVPQLPPAK